jgi:hypothetical protein
MVASGHMNCKRRALYRRISWVFLTQCLDDYVSVFNCLASYMRVERPSALGTRGDRNERDGWSYSSPKILIVI